MSRRPLVISHRTNRGTMPENTIAGIEAAIADGVDGVEIDVRATRDGHVVLLHDATLARTSGDPRAVSELTLEDLRDVRLLPAGALLEPQPVPTLDESLAATAGRAILVIEVKQSGIEHAVARAIRTARAAEWCWIWAFDPAVAAACRTAIPSVPVSLNVSAGSSERYGFESYVDVAVRTGLAAVSLSHMMVDDASVIAARRRGLSTYAWTVNDPRDIERIRDADVDAICGDFPKAIHAALE